MNSSSDRTLTYLLLGLAGIAGINALFSLAHKFNKSFEKPKTLLQLPKKKPNYKSSKRPNKIHKIVLTGGPCSGKTTALTEITAKLRERGYVVYTVPEAATLVALGGGSINTSQMTVDENVKFQGCLARYMMDQEDKFVELAHIGDRSAPVVILFDRGMMDNKAYMQTEEAWNQLLEDNEWTVSQLRDKRYDGVIHLVTAADGAGDHYTTENNKARYETDTDSAVSVDKKLKDAWYGHPNFRIIDNRCNDFQEKMNRAFNTVLQMIGVTSESPIKYNKYLLKKSGENPIPRLPDDLKVETFEIEDTFLEGSDCHTDNRIRKRGEKGNFFYEHIMTTYPRSLNKKDYRNDGLERRMQITGREFLVLYETRDKHRTTLKKVRQCFIWQGQYMFIDSILNVKGGFSVIYIDPNTNIEEIKLPSGLEIEQDITEVKEYTSYEVSKLKEHPIRLKSRGELFANIG